MAAICIAFFNIKHASSSQWRLPPTIALKDGLLKRRRCALTAKRRLNFSLYAQRMELVHGELEQMINSIT